MAISDADATTETVGDAKSDTTTERGVARRGLVAGALAGIAALFVGRASPAAAEDGVPLILGMKNSASTETLLESNPGPVGSPAFSAMQGGSAARLGNAPVDTSRFPVGTGGMPLNTAAVAGESDGNIGVFGNAGPRGVGTWGASEGFIGAWGASLTGVGVLGQTYPGDIEQPHETLYPAAGVFGVGGRAPGTWGLSTAGPGAWGQSNFGPGVLGQTGMMATRATSLADTTYPAAGVYGVGGDKVGIWGVATSGIGSWGQSDTGVGILGQTGRPVAPSPLPIPYPASGVLGIGADAGSGVIGWIGHPVGGAKYPRSGVLGIGNGDLVGVWGLSNANMGTWGQSDSGVGVSGQSNNIGAWFKKGDVPIQMSELEPAALHTTAMGTDVSTCARAEKGVAMMAETSDPAGTGLMIETPEGGVAIHAMGRILSNQIMLSLLGKGIDFLRIPCNEINANSHVSVMLRNDVGAAVSWIELQPGVGIVVHFDRRTRVEGSLTYAVTEMAGAH